MELLERTEQLATLARQLGQVHGGGRLVLVSGEAGAGKSALVHHFVGTLRDDVDVVVGQCDDLFAPRPLGPLTDIARGRPGPLATALAAGEDGAVFEAFLSELANPTRPIVVVLEDVQWADEATLDLLRYTARRLDALTCLLVVTHRDNLAPDHALRRAVGTLIGPSITRLHLPPLSVDAVRALLGDRADDAEQFHTQTGGNPFYVLEALHYEQGHVPPTVRDMILARAAALTGAARDALDAAAVLGHADARVIQQVGDCDAAAVDECVSADLLMGEVHLSFRHDLTRQGIENELTPLRKRQLHRRALEALGDDADVVTLAHHAVASGDREAIIDLAVRAGDHCVALGAHRQGALLYASAADHADLLPRAEQIRLHRARADAAFECERLDDAVVASQAVVLLMDETDPDLAYWQCRLADAYWMSDDKDASWALLREVVAKLEPLGASDALAYARAKLACHYLMEGRFEEAIEHGQRACEMAERLGREDTALMAKGFFGAAMACMADHRGLLAMQEVVDRAKTAGLAVEACRTGGNLGCQYLGFGMPDRALAVFDEVIATADEHDFVARKNCMLLSRAETLLMIGRWDQAVDDSRRVLAEPDLTAASRCYGSWHIGRVRARRGDPAPFELLDQALDAAIETQEVQYLLPVRATRAEAAWLGGDDDLARAELEEALPVADQAEAQHLRMLATWTRRLGMDWDPPAIVEPVDAILAGDVATVAEFWKRSGFPYEMADALGESDDVEHLREAHEILTALGARPRAMQVARKLRDRGARDVKRGPRATTRANAAGLTARELEVASLLARGLTNTEIADKLVLSSKTVEHHVSAVLSKLGVENRRGVASAAAAVGVELLQSNA